MVTKPFFWLKLKITLLYGSLFFSFFGRNCYMVLILRFRLKPILAQSSVCARRQPHMTVLWKSFDLRPIEWWIDLGSFLHHWVFKTQLSWTFFYIIFHGFSVSFLIYALCHDAHLVIKFQFCAAAFPATPAFPFIFIFELSSFLTWRICHVHECTACIPVLPSTIYII